MTEYLFAAEADQIQGFVFRSAKLREARGASRMLDEFCRDAPDVLARQMSLDEGEGKDAHIVSKAGGAFRIVFRDEGKAREFGRYLTEMYRHVASASMSSVVVPFHDDGFAAAQNEANHRLRAAKLAGRPTQSTPHLPHIAFCASCGTELASNHDRRHADERANYLCDTCRQKAKRGSASKREGTELRDPADAIAEFDPRRYVAYLKADGNNMGKLFSACNHEELTALSETLANVMTTSLTEADSTMGALIKRLNEEEKWSYDPQDVLTPLLLAGDDCFALLPAPYALDFARRFCLEFEQRMEAALAKPPLSNLKARLEGEGKYGKPTLTAALVICKGNYPYTLAHDRAESLLKAAKKVAKNATAQASMLDFEVIVGNELLGGEDDMTTKGFVMRSGTISLRPYWVTEQGVESDVLRGTSLSVNRILGQRLKLSPYPRGRIAQLRQMFDVDASALQTSAKQKNWRERWVELRGRIARFDPLDLNEAWRALGNDADQPGELMTVSRFDKSVKAHGLPDLIEMWEYSYKLDEPQEHYSRRSA